MKRLLHKHVILWLFISLFVIPSLVLVTPQTAKAQSYCTLTENFDDMHIAGFTVIGNPAYTSSAGETGNGVASSGSFNNGWNQDAVILTVEVPVSPSWTIKQMSARIRLTYAQYISGGGEHFYFDYKPSGGSWTNHATWSGGWSAAAMPPSNTWITALVPYGGYGLMSLTNVEAVRYRIQVVDNLGGAVPAIAYDDIVVTYDDAGGECELLPTADFTFTPDYAAAPEDVYFTDTSNGNGFTITDWNWDFDDGGTSTEEDPVHTFEEPGNYEVTLTVTTSQGTDDFTQTVHVIDSGGAPGGGLYYPLAADDISPEFGIKDFTNYISAFYPNGYAADYMALDAKDNVVVAVSQTAYASVFAVHGGEVIAIDRVPSSCVATCLVTMPNTANGTLWAQRLDVSANNVYLVTVADDDEHYLYIVRDAPQYVTLGDEIEAGCILGKTVKVIPGFSIPFIPFIQPLGSLQFAPDLSEEVALVSYVDFNYEAQELVSLFAAFPTNAEACNADPEFAECLGSNPRFLGDGDGWTMIGSGFFAEGGGVWLNPGAEVVSLMVLDDEEVYTVTAGGIDTLNPGTVTLHIGPTSESFAVDQFTHSAALEEAEPLGGSGGVYEVGIRNSGNFTIYVDYVCVTQGGPPINPSACYFSNHSFDYGNAGWSAGTDIFFRPDGTVYMKDTAESYLSQPVDLEPGSYTISIRARPYFSIPSDLIESPTVDIDLFYEFDDGPQSLGSMVASGDQTFVFNTYSTTFLVATQTSGTMTFDLDIDSGSAELLGIVIDRVCLEREGGYTPGAGTPPILRAECEAYPYPPASDTPSWIVWHWNRLQQFFKCDLMVLLNRWYLFVRQALTAVAYAIRYWLIVAQGSATWLNNTFFPYLDGHFANIAMGRNTTIIQDDVGGCHDIFCLLDTILSTVIGPIVDAITSIVDTLLSIFGQVAGLLLSVVTALISLLLSLLGTLIGLFQQMIGYLQGLLFGINAATPTPIPGIPQCQLDPQSNGICIMLWTLENTVFADEGQLYIPLLIGFISVMMLLWLVDTFRRELSNAGDKV